MSPQHPTSSMISQQPSSSMSIEQQSSSMSIEQQSSSMSIEQQSSVSQEFSENESLTDSQDEILSTPDVQSCTSTSGTHIVLPSPNSLFFDVNINVRLLNMFNISVINRLSSSKFMVDAMFDLRHSYNCNDDNESVRLCRTTLIYEFKNFINHMITNKTFPSHIHMILNAIDGLHENSLDKHINHLVFSKSNIMYQMKQRNAVTLSIIRRYNQYKAKLIASYKEYHFCRLMYYNQIVILITNENSFQYFHSIIIAEQNRNTYNLQMLENKVNDIFTSINRRV
jgi:antitoxin component HigA of HigAB toxin-antitoxin module